MAIKRHEAAQAEERIEPNHVARHPEQGVLKREHLASKTCRPQDGDGYRRILRKLTEAKVLKYILLHN